MRPDAGSLRTVRAQSTVPEWATAESGAKQSPTAPIDPFVRRTPRPTGDELLPLGPDDQFVSPDDFSADPRTDLQATLYPLDDDAFLGIPPEGNSAGGAASTWRPPVIGPRGDAATSPALSLDSGNFEVIALAPPDDELGVVSFDMRTAVAFGRWPGFTIRPRVGVHLLQNADTAGLPSQLYDVSVEARMYFPFGERWLTEFAISPGIFSDFQNLSADAYRVQGRALAFYRWSPQLQLVGGAIYLDRDDVLALPVAGLIWVPDPDLRLELMLPRPRVAVRYGGDDQHERWAYLAGEFGGIGGGSYAVVREPIQFDDVVTYSDYRLLVGVEFKFPDGSGWRIEGGYIFSRQLQFQSEIGDTDLTNTLLLRAAMSF